MDQLEALDISDSKRRYFFGKVVLKGVFTSKVHRRWGRYIDLSSDQQGDKVFDKPYMLWMCIWMCPHHVMVLHADQAFGILLEIFATLS